MSTTDEQQVPPLSAFLRPELPPAALHGLPGEVAAVLSGASGADPAAVLLTFLALLGNAAGPQPHAWFGGADTRRGCSSSWSGMRRRPEGHCSRRGGETVRRGGPGLGR